MHMYRNETIYFPDFKRKNRNRKRVSTNVGRLESLVALFGTTLRFGIAARQNKKTRSHPLFRRLKGQVWWDEAQGRKARDELSRGESVQRDAVGRRALTRSEVVRLQGARRTWFIHSEAACVYLFLYLFIRTVLESLSKVSEVKRRALRNSILTLARSVNFRSFYSRRRASLLSGLR